METLQVEPLETMVGRSAANARRRRTPAPFSPWWALVLLISDVGMFVFSAFAVALVRFGGAAIYEKRLALGIATMILIAFWIAFFIRLGLYRRSFASSFRDEFYYTLAALAIGVAPLLIVFTLVPAISPSRSALLELFAVAAVGVSTARAALHALRTRWALQSARRIAIVGVPERVASVVQELLLTSQDEVLRLPIADFDERLQEAMAKNQAVTELDWIRAATAWGCDTLIATEALPPSIMPTILRTTEPLGIKFAFAPTRFRPQAYDFTLQKDGGLALICPRSLAVCTPQVSLVRRIIDLALVVPAIVLLSPLLAAVALLVYLDSGTPIIYRQTRVGLHGHEFEILKFRSMPLDVEKTTGPVWADPNRQRV
ncbi:MAG: sugar transferase, partial [Vulcanimicrobiaceae bacterium]